MSLLTLSSVRSLVRSTLLREGRLEDARAKFSDIDVDELSCEDPSGSSQLKYLMWMARQRAAGASLEDLLPTVRYFHRNIVKFEGKKDINSYATLAELEDAVKEASERSTGREKRALSKEGSEIVWEDEDSVLVFVGTRESCQLYGKGTKWCITMRDASFFEQYTGANVVFYFLLNRSPKGDPFDKVALAVKRDRENRVLAGELELFDAGDKNISREALAKRIPGSVAAVSAALADAVRRPKGLIAKINDGEATEEDEREALRLYGKESEVVKMIAGKLKSAEALMKLSGNEDAGVRMYVAENPSVPAEVLRTLSRDENAEVRMYVAGNLSAPVEVLRKLSGDGDEWVRESVAENPAAPAEALRTLSRDGDAWVRKSVAGNPSAPAEALRTLSGDENAVVRRSVAENPATPVEVLRTLSGDENERVRMYVARNSSAPVEVLRKLSGDENAVVQERARETLKKRVVAED